ncbi:unnamed protein product [Paramecium primaurelia]|uniref:A to I editase domain-containing protein n=1 Tax=Paramecium primaurelia TaxID=5886 RepID=A0A8S1L6A8_PARPR|nr:unnamed protein product [Paramecium primaurelia]
MNNYLSDIKQITHEKYQELIQNEKVNQNAVLASISLVQKEQNVILCSLGTGSKAVGLNHMNEQNHCLHSCHAEVIAKRGFQLWLYEVFSKPNEIDKYFEKKETKYSLKNDYKVCFYVTQPPCGQAQLFPESKIYGMSAARPFSEFFKETENIPNCDSQRLRSTPANSKTPIQQKNPSFCCTDKLMIWNIVGIQGALLNQYINPIYIDNLIIEFREQFSLKQVFDVRKRSGKNKNDILKINNKLISKQFRIQKPKLIYTRKNLFTHSPYHPKNDELNKRINKDINQQSLQSFSYLYVDSCGTEKINSINGLKWGLAKKDISRLQFLPKITKYQLFQKFKNLYYSFESKQLLCNYREAKNRNIKYLCLKTNIKQCFQEWSLNKIQYEQFQ